MSNAQTRAKSCAQGVGQGFNAAETRRLAKEYWEAQMNKVNHPMLPPEDRPQIYKSPLQKGAWGKQKPNLPVPEFDFLSELRAALIRSDEAENATKASQAPPKPRAP